MEKRTIHISIGDAKLDRSLKSPNAQLQCQARAKKSGPRKCCSGELSRNRQSTLTVNPCKSSLKNCKKKVLLKVQELQSSFQRIQGCLHQALFLQSVYHFSLEWSWDHSAVGISATTNAKNTKSSKVSHGVLSALDLSA